MTPETSSAVQSAAAGTVGSQFADIGTNDIANIITSAQPLVNPTTSTDGGNSDVGSTFGGNAGAAISGKTASQISALNQLSGLTGGPSIPMAGTLAGLAASQTPEQALGVVGTAAGNMLSPGLGSAISFGMNPSTVGGINLAASLNPVGALYSGVAALTGLPSIGELAVGTPQTVDPKTGMVTEATTGLLGAGGTFGGTPAMSSPVSVPGNITVTDLGTLNGGGGGFGFGSESAASDANAGDAAGVGGETGGTAFAANGGNVTGPGTGTSDSIKAKLSDGEYVISADVVDALGQEFFDMLQKQFHTPVAMQGK